ncbi:MAG: helix-turn-helix transcriptional regulator [Lentimicrobiaceae bacterium]|nr:helix-turn-helix transcriptional regulator [Lentimicrobiaceae bacterium]MCO5265955.1 helix-turn-helix domain-containing protein [Lentimicrobium sp.]
MNNRISLVLKTKDISPSQLADELGVQRSGISHILNGRNKPSLEFVQKLIKRYPDISMQWILFGEGPMMNPYPEESSHSVKKEFIHLTDKPKPVLMELFSDDEEEESIDELQKEESIGEYDDNLTDKQEDIKPEKLTGNEPEKNEMAQTSEIKSEAEIMPFILTENRNEGIGEEAASKKNPEQSEKIVRKISKILVFYTDRTFVEYKPGEE